MTTTAADKIRADIHFYKSAVEQINTLISKEHENVKRYYDDPACIEQALQSIRSKEAEVRRLEAAIESAEKCLSYIEAEQAEPEPVEQPKAERPKDKMTKCSVDFSWLYGFKWYTRRVWQDGETGEYYVKVDGGRVPLIEEPDHNGKLKMTVEDATDFYAHDVKTGMALGRLSEVR